MGEVNQKSKKLLSWSGLFLGALVSIVLFVTLKKIQSERDRLLRPSILILNISSLNADVLFSKKGKEIMPKLSSYLEKAKVYRAAVTERSWEGLESHLWKLAPNLFRDNGYTVMGRGRPIEFFKFMEFPAEHLPEPIVLDIDRVSRPMGVDYLTAMFKKHKSDRVFVMANFSLFGPPLLHMENLRKYKGPLRMLKEVLKTGKIIERWPALVQLFPMNYLKRRISAKLRHRMRSQNPSALREALKLSIQDMNRPDLLEKWKASKFFIKDKKMISKHYFVNLESLDKSIGKVINASETRFGQDQLITMVVGGNGLSLMEHGHILYGSSVYESELRVPLIIKNSYLSPEVVKRQVGLSALAGLIDKVVSGQLNLNMLDAYLRRDFHSETVTSTNCLKTDFSVRNRDGKKIIYSVASGETRQYDLLADPGEREPKELAQNGESFVLKERLFDHIVSDGVGDLRPCIFTSNFFASKASEKNYKR